MSRAMPRRRPQPARAIDTTMERWGRLDIVVNNAGLGRRSTVETVTLEDWDQTMAINLRSTILFTQMAAEIMKKQGKAPSSTSPPSRESRAAAPPPTTRPQRRA